MIDVVIVGSGFAGLGAAIALTGAGRDDFLILEKGTSLGGTWRDNTYPGCACDVQSHLYSFSFAPNPHWTRTFARQPEIRAYLEDVADRYRLRDRIRFGAEVTDAEWDGAGWVVGTADGQTVRARVLVWATGPLHIPPGPRDRGPRRLHRHGVPLRPLEPRARPARPPRRRDRHGRERDPVRAAGAAAGGAPHAVPAHRALGAAQARPRDPRRPAQALPRRARRAEAGAGAGLRAQRAARRRLPQPAADAGDRARRPRLPRPRVRRPPRPAAPPPPRPTPSAASASCSPTTTTRRCGSPTSTS